MRIIAHRSGPITFPGQTIQSAKEALSLGADMIELDVRLTKDGKVAISHDHNVGGFFNKDVCVDELTATEFLALRHKKHPEYGSHLFEDYLRCGVFPILIHVKEDRTIPAMLELSEKYECFDKVVLGVHSFEAVETIRNSGHDIKILSFCPDRDKIEMFCKSEVDYIRPWEGWLNDDNIALVRKYGKEVWVMTGEVPGYYCGYTSPENLERIVNLGVDGILINEVPKLKSILDKKA